MYLELGYGIEVVPRLAPKAGCKYWSEVHVVHKRLTYRTSTFGRKLSTFVPNVPGT